MPNLLTTTAPDEVRKALNEYADLLDIYARHQLAFGQRMKLNRDRGKCHTRAEVYNSLAIELRETIVKAPDK